MSFDLRDLAGSVGVCLVTVGVGMMHVPSALIVCGVILLCGAVLAARR
jgi:hypothetical protein